MQYQKSMFLKNYLVELFGRRIKANSKIVILIIEDNLYVFSTTIVNQKIGDSYQNTITSCVHSRFDL